MKHVKTFESFNISEAMGDVKSLGITGDVLYVDVKGHKYGYKQKEGEDLKEIARKFEKMLQFASWKALNFLKRHTEEASGTKKTELVKEGARMTNYMFMENLKIIKKAVDKMLKLDPTKVDELLNNGHDWAADHISTSKDDIEEVCGFLCNQEGPVTESKKEDLEKMYKGKTIELISMDDPNPIEPGTKGEVVLVDSTGTLHIKWENGRSLGVIPGEDKFKIIK